MNLVGTTVLITLSVLYVEQDDIRNEGTYTVALRETGCASTRRMRCSYDFVEASAKREGKGQRHFNLVFYQGADQAEGKADAISRLDRLFNIKREVSSAPGLANTGTVSYTKPVTFRIEGSMYEFSGEDGEKAVVDIEKKTRP